MKTIVLTGGGSAGHVTPNLALIPLLSRENWDIHYIGSKDGIEKHLIEEVHVPYHSISSGKLRRYFDLKNFKDPFRVLKGVMESYQLLRELKPNVIFSKGGFVSVPVVIAGWLNRIPVLIHESDITPGLANKIATKFASTIFVTFEEAARHFPAEKTVCIGSPIREEMLKGDKKKGLYFLGFTEKKPIITVMGGSLGSVHLNAVLREALPELLKDFQIVHLCGNGNIDSKLQHTYGYRQFEYISAELPDVMAATDFVISRAGSNAIFEFLALKKPMLLVPLPKSSSRGDQILNAQSFEKKGFCTYLYDEEVTKETLLKAVTELDANRVSFIDSMQKYKMKNSLQEILNRIKAL